MTAIHPLPQPSAPTPPHGRDNLVRMYDGAMSHLDSARKSAPAQQKESISTVVKILSNLKEVSEKTKSPEDDGTDLSALYAYMIDRLSISHSGLDIDPINEVSWLLRNLRDFSTRPKGRSPVDG